MSLAALPPSQQGLDDLAEAMLDLYRRQLIRDFETVLAFVTLWLLNRVAAGRTSAAEADRLFTLLDARLTRPGGESVLSADAQELLFEGEFFAHFGEPEGPDPDHLRRLALAILQRTER